MTNPNGGYAKKRRNPANTKQHKKVSYRGAGFSRKGLQQTGSREGLQQTEYGGPSTVVGRIPAFRNGVCLPQQSGMHLNDYS